MKKGATLGKIEKEIEKLTSRQKLKLVEKLVHQLQTGRLAIKKDLDWSKLYGLGKDLWKGKDAQEYVNRLREDRV